MKYRKILYFDVETTGTDSRANALIQLSGLIEIEGVIKDKFNYFIRPHDGAVIEDEALEVHGIGREELESFKDLKVVHDLFTSKLGTWVDKYDRGDKFYIAGYNVSFDLDFLSEFFKRANDPYLGSWINWKRLDPLPMLHWADYTGKIKLENYKLETVCKHYGIDIDAHDAMSDIIATRELLSTLTVKYI